jgi:hypothetical protein
LIFNNEIVIKYLKENCISENNFNKFQYIDLNKMYNVVLEKFMDKEISHYFNEGKRFKVCFRANGIDKFNNKNKMLSDFKVRINYSFQ